MSEYLLGLSAVGSIFLLLVLTGGYTGSRMIVPDWLEFVMYNQGWNLMIRRVVADLWAVDFHVCSVHEADADPQSGGGYS